ncbi:preprotein translocase subunit SecG [Thiothrix nivea]|uniref:Protein-export membrane protein SecG n=1 Tax=Thiothrix nivea (strain ATCC 35100 / DSM 5205 / JP2) TaxID=870187 RepID=A0A656HDJ9_THINJ|nr:preprotein translocase subunit SecG [Thiothrix nivea]EIJ34054.1 preprotein translocase, SecG subunit [Thiothrix nivea DSM 5205]
MLYNVLLIVQIVVSVGIIVLVLMQQGKGADAGAAFGSGASGTVFGARGSANFLSRTTAILATVFFLNSIALAFLASGRTIENGSIMDSAAQLESKTQQAVESPVAAGDVPPVPGTDAAGSDVPPAPDAEQVKTDVPPAATAEDKPVAGAEAKELPAADEKSVQDK